MQLFQCQHCGQPVYFENTRCERCGRALGYLPARATLSALEAKGDAFRALADPARLYRYCGNASHAACNWLIDADSQGGFCISCRHNHTIPDLSQAGNEERWRRLEAAKRRLIYSLLKLGLPLPDRVEDPDDGLAFDFLAEAPRQSGPHLLTGHDHGLITINIAEADDAERERKREQMGEPYRTLLGHFRHEIGHFYWARLVDGRAALRPFRALFGDERRDYKAALQAHYNQGAPTDWNDRFVSTYASSHPWEDFAETWAHYLHIVDTLETANAFGMRIRPRVAKASELETRIDFDPHQGSPMAQIIEAWLPLTFALNSLNRSMGQSDLYPFVLGPTVIEKLGFVHELIHWG